tara:strand:- start:3698 stop:3988 length:291 start_codon:yes stop_codon:yes gene_type:complete
MDYATGWQYSVTGTGIQHDGSSITPGTTSSTNTIDGVTSTWTGLDLNNKPNWTQTTPGAAFQMTETYLGPGLQNQTIIQRVTEVTSVTDTTSIFSQ